MFNNLLELVTSMPTEQQCRDYFANQRWPEGKPYCVHCGSAKVYSIQKGRRYECGEKGCKKRFSVTCGTIFHGSHIPLNKWFMAIYLATNNKKGISSHQLGKHIGVTQKTGWFMLHRVRELMKPKNNVKLNNIVEIDECWTGGKVRNMTKAKRAKLRNDTGGTIQNKTMVVGLVERGGELKLIACGKDNSSEVLQPLVLDNVDKAATLITDSATGYTGLVNEFAGHEVVNHSQDEYVRDKTIYTNSIEGVFSHFKRMVIGTYHQLSPKHLQRYCDETMYRYSTRKINDASRFVLSLQKTDGRLTYKTLINTPIYTEQSRTLSQPNYIIVEGRKTTPVYQLKDGVIIAQYPTITKAASMLGINKRAILGVLKGRKKTTHGFSFQYA
jgi:transposase-like protein